MDKDEISALFFDRNVELDAASKRLPEQVHFRRSELCDIAIVFAEYFDAGGRDTGKYGGVGLPGFEQEMASYAYIGEVGEKFMVAARCWDE
ncbi:MAG: hypothetical protein QGG54_01125 [Gammaproteobacteria bacterium]|jgi:hypothetical protein|nr:hypothetical protein [Gammaproteobacteria bacterium]|tara:strand:- start:5488 stop:5760 length:273 start_codon:yes stop_codon:yes gene_type:complete